jgi:tetratricopeptide (TPR) repeat protein
LNKGDNDRAIADNSEAIRLDPGNFDAYSNRAGAYVSKGDNDRAIADASEAIRLDPGNAIAYSNRAGVYMSNGDNDRAIADASEAIRLDPKSMPAYFSRGRANLYSGEAPCPRRLPISTKQACSIRKTPMRPCGSTSPASAGNLPSRLLQAVSRIDMTAWPAPVIRLFLGQLTSTAVLAAAGNADPNTKTGQVCEANFYGGEFAMRKAATAEATHLFRLAASNCSKGLIEWDGANAELKALGVLP